MYEQLKARYDRWNTLQGALVSRHVLIKERAENLNVALQDTKAAVSLLQYIAAELSRVTEDQTANLVSIALKETFRDQDLTLLVDHDVYRGQPGVKFRLRDEVTGVEGDPMESFGGGPASLLGVLLRVICTFRQPGMAKVLIFDEPLAQVSSLYAPAAGKLLRKICEPPPTGLGFEMLVVTHQEAIADAAHLRYNASNEDGSLVLEEVENG